MLLSVFFFRNSLQFKKVSLPLQPQTRNNGAIAQLVEQRTENPCVPGSIPGGTTLKRLIIKQLLIKVAAFFMSFRCLFRWFFNPHVNQDVNRKMIWLQPLMYCVTSQKLLVMVNIRSWFVSAWMANESIKV